MPRPFRFGVLSHNTTSSLGTLISKARTAEVLGYATFLVPDHLGDQFAPAVALAAVAGATKDLRVGSCVFNNDFRHPLMLAKDVATLDMLSEGRSEWGLGAGWMRSEYDQAGIAFDSADTRIRRMQEAVRLIKLALTGGPVSFCGDYYTARGWPGRPRTLQQPYSPLFMGGGGQRMLSIAAQEADIVGLTTKGLLDGSGLDRSDLLLAATEQKVAWIGQAAGPRLSKLELSLLVADMCVTDQWQQGVSQLADRLKLLPEQVRASLHLLVGTPEQICEKLRVSRDRYGISYWVVWEEHLQAFAPVVARLSGGSPNA